MGASVISTHIRTVGLHVKTTIIFQLKRLCVPDCACTENMFINSVHISLYDISLTQNTLYQIKKDVAVWKRLGCPQRNQRTWWQIVATPYTGLAYLWQLSINSVPPGWFGCSYKKKTISNLVVLIDIFRSCYDNASRWMPRDLTNVKPTLIQVMTWCRQATSHYLSYCWPRSKSP